MTKGKRQQSFHAHYNGTVWEGERSNGATPDPAATSPMEVEEDEILATEEQSSRAEAELQEIIEQQEGKGNPAVPSHH